LPLPDVDGSLAELSYALDTLKLDGIVLFSNARGVYLGDEKLDPVFEELERRRAVVFVHPTASPDPAAHALGRPDSLIDFTADTTRAIAHLHCERGTAADTFRRLYWDTALSWGDPVLQLLRSVVGMDRVLYGSDHPYLRRDLAVASLEQLQRTAVLNYDERSAVLGKSALSLLPRLDRQRNAKPRR
jgi:predicted TIM-barrel fold metal-dependent hydrolase